MEEFFAGIVKMIEERLGPFGRPCSTVIVILAALGIGAWGFNLFVVNAVVPVATFIQRLFEGSDVLTVEQLRGPIIAMLAYAALSVPLWFAVNLVIRRTIIARAERIISEAREAVDEEEKELKRVKEETDRLVHKVAELEKRVAELPSKPLDDGKVDSQPR